MKNGVDKQLQTTLAGVDAGAYTNTYVPHIMWDIEEKKDMQDITEIKNCVSNYNPDIERNDGDERWYRIVDETKWLPSVTTMIGSVMNKGYGLSLIHI